MKNEHCITPLADDYVAVCKSPSPKDVYLYSPGICVMKSGRIVITMDISGAGMDIVPGVKYEGKRKDGSTFSWQGRVYISDDGGKTWTHTANYPLLHARPFLDGDTLYIVGHAEDLSVIRSDDGGLTWTKPEFFTQGENWHQAPCNVLYKNGYIYLVMERHKKNVKRSWVSTLSPFLMRGKLGTDLTKKENWTFASEIVFKDFVDSDKIEYFGIPFLLTEKEESTELAPHRYTAPLGWLESNVVQFTDPRHPLYDPTGHTFHIWARANTERTNIAAMLKVVENPDGTMTSMLETAPSGKTMVFVPCPGGQMKFHILYDDVTELYWLLSTQSTDSMVKLEDMEDDRYGLPDNERQRLTLHFSKNCIDWCFAGLVAAGKTQRQARHYASMAIDGEDLCILSRSGDEEAATAHNGNVITFHRVKNFRGLVY
ncbi:MAG TPA: sialidase family protein [Oscillospiraceae bacterium]|nr:sialidase family protein [Oscillospiraceae bacterium]HPF55680.1 sialidase family protein [Clostridiales bacterium]HPK35711.1 sialidase family protein [Oscillospiraceae bacterium]HPR75081.1 sialidase family protein [Oscillospiraceae bacterium]